MTDVANAGPIRPPLVYLGSLALGGVLHLTWPLLPRGASPQFGAPIVLLAVCLFAFSVRALQAAGTPVPGNRPTTAIVRTGAFRFSRNPIYLAFSLLQLGIAVWLNSVWLLATLVAAVILVTTVVIREEERYLERKFGTEYLDYKARVRRWV